MTLYQHPREPSQYNSQRDRFQPRQRFLIVCRKVSRAASRLYQFAEAMIRVVIDRSKHYLSPRAEAWPNFIENSREHQDAMQFMRGVVAREGVDYTWVWEYAKERWDYLVKDNAVIENKAASIVNYLGGGTGLFAIGILSKIDSSNTFLVWWTLPALLCAVLSVIVAILVKKPAITAALPTIANAKMYADDFASSKEKATTVFLGQWYLACTDLKLISDRKARLTEIATWLFCIAVALLFLPVIIGALHPPVGFHK
jgi:hypothetical protein